MHGGRTRERHKVRLAGASATLLVTLYAKALDSRSPHSILQDERAAQILDSIEFDSSQLLGFRSYELIVVRARQYDEWVRDFINRYDDALIVYLGVGLDSRVTRIQRPASVSWFDVDFPEVIQLRRNFFQETSNYKMIASSITDSDWLQSIPSSRPTMILTEGCLAYLTKEQVERLLKRVSDYFTRGRVALDVVNSAGIEFARRQLAEKLGAAHTWSVDDLADVDALNLRLRRLCAASVYAAPYAKELPFRSRMFFKFVCLFPQFRDSMRLALYEF